MRGNWDTISKLAWGLALAVFLAMAIGYFVLRRDLSEARATIAEAELAEARLSSQLDALDAAARENVQFLSSKVVGIEALRALCDREMRGQDMTIVTLCGNVSTLTSGDAFGSVLIAETSAASARGRGEFEESIARYGEALEALSQFRERLYSTAPAEYDWRRMLMLEGRAYGLYRVGRLEEARSMIDEALELGNPDSVEVSGFVYSTHLKIRCASGRVEDADKLYRDYRAILASALEREEAGGERPQEEREFWIEYREDDLGYFTQDEELEHLCELA